MQIIEGETLVTMTGFSHSKKQELWFKERGITYQFTANGKKLWTTDDWLNGKDKYKASNDDGFNLAALNHAS
jgi:hypothetical protein